MLKTEYVGHSLQYKISLSKFILTAHLILKNHMETLQYHDARPEQNRVRKIRKVFISLRQLMRIVTNRHFRFPTNCNFFERKIYE